MKEEGGTGWEGGGLLKSVANLRRRTQSDTIAWSGMGSSGGGGDNANARQVLLRRGEGSKRW